MPFCINCGNKLTETDKFCSNCGEKSEVSEVKDSSKNSETIIKGTIEEESFERFFKKDDDVCYYFKDEIPKRKWSQFKRDYSFRKLLISKCTVFFYSDSTPGFWSNWEENIANIITITPDRQGFAIVRDDKNKWHLLINQAGLSGNFCLTNNGKHLIELLDEPGVLNVNISYKSGVIENMRFKELGEKQTEQLKNFLKNLVLYKNTNQKSNWPVYSIKV